MKSTKHTVESKKACFCSDELVGKETEIGKKEKRVLLKKESNT